MLLCDSYALKRISIQALYDYKAGGIENYKGQILISIQALYDYKGAPSATEEVINVFQFKHCTIIRQAV